MRVRKLSCIIDDLHKKGTYHKFFIVEETGDIETVFIVELFERGKILKFGDMMKGFKKWLWR